VGFDDADDDIGPLAVLLLRRGQHFIGLADAGCGAEKQLQPAAGLLLHCFEQCVRRGATFA
jgi:hypothetical protein